MQAEYPRKPTNLHDSSSPRQLSLEPPRAPRLITTHGVHQDPLPIMQRKLPALHDLYPAVTTCLVYYQSGDLRGDLWT